MPVCARHRAAEASRFRTQPPPPLPVPCAGSNSILLLAAPKGIELSEGRGFAPAPLHCAAITIMRVGSSTQQKKTEALTFAFCLAKFVRIWYNKKAVGSFQFVQQEGGDSVGDFHHFYRLRHGRCSQLLHMQMAR